VTLSEKYKNVNTWDYKNQKNSPGKQTKTVGECLGFPLL